MTLTQPTALALQLFVGEVPEQVIPQLTERAGRGAAEQRTARTTQCGAVSAELYVACGRDGSVCSLGATVSTDPNRRVAFRAKTYRSSLAHQGAMMLSGTCSTNEPPLEACFRVNGVLIRQAFSYSSTWKGRFPYFVCLNGTMVTIGRGNNLAVQHVPAVGGLISV